MGYVIKSWRDVTPTLSSRSSLVVRFGILTIAITAIIGIKQTAFIAKHQVAEKPSMMRTASMGAIDRATFITSDCLATA